MFQKCRCRNKSCTFIFELQMKRQHLLLDDIQRVDWTLQSGRRSHHYSVMQNVRSLV